MFRSTVWALVVVAAAACSGDHQPTSPPSTPSFALHPCSVTGTLQLASAAASRVDCGNGGTTVTLAGDGASYLIVPQFATSLVPSSFVSYRLVASAATASAATASATATSLPSSSAALDPMRGLLRATPRVAQLAFDGALRARARAAVARGTWLSGARMSTRKLAGAVGAMAVIPAPSVGSIRSFRVLADSTGRRFKSVNARLAFAGDNVLIYVDTLSPANGFTAAQIQSFGTLFDHTLYPIDTGAFGPPSDVDQNGRVIMLMSPAVNALTPSSECDTQGFVAGFFEEEDLGGAANDPNSNNGEIFYSIVPDPNGTASCSHTADDVGFAVPATFLHELQHLISFSQHFVVHGGDPEYGWLDEGLSIVAEELGSVYYEQKCPGTACRTEPAQLFPDSSQGFIAGFLFDSYAYALKPDTASVTLHSDADDGFSWRGGDWLLARWLGDQFGVSVYRHLDENGAIGVANIESVTGQSFPSLFSDFGIALFADSLPGLPRATAPARDRFVTRNVRQLWARLFATSGGSPDVPRAFPIPVSTIGTDTTATQRMYPGAMGFFRLNTPANVSSVSVQFAGPGGSPLSSSLKPQLAIFRLPAGQ